MASRETCALHPSAVSQWPAFMCGRSGRPLWLEVSNHGPYVYSPSGIAVLSDGCAPMAPCLAQAYRSVWTWWRCRQAGTAPLGAGGAPDGGGGHGGLAGRQCSMAAVTAQATAARFS